MSLPGSKAPLLDQGFLQQLERLVILYRKGAIGPQQGERRSSKRGQSVEFADFRPYVAGDDIRRIDWNAYARLERYFIKLFVEEQDLIVHFLIDSSRSMRWGQPEKLSYAIRAAAALAYIALVGLDRVEVNILGNSKSPAGDRYPMTRGKMSAAPLFQFLQALSEKEPSQNDPPLAVSLKNYASTLSNPGPLLIFTDLFDEGWQPILNRLAGRGFEVSIIHILAPDEIDPALSGDLRLIDSETGAGVEITADYESLERYRQVLRSWQAGWQNFCQARSIHYVTLSTSKPVEEVLFGQFRRQGILR